MNIGVLALVFAAVGGLVSLATYTEAEEKRPQRADVFDYTAVIPKEL